MSDTSTRVKVAIAVLVAAVIVAVPHLLTVERGLSDVVEEGEVHQCPPIPEEQTFRIFVRNISCEDGVDLVTDVLTSAACQGGFCTVGEDFACNRTVRSEDRLFWLCRIAGGGAKVRFIQATGPAPG